MTRLEWDENKRLSNLRKHGLDFENANWVLDSPFRLDSDSVRAGELRTQSFAWVQERLTVLTLVHTDRPETVRIISFRSASRKERQTYDEWLKNQHIDP